MYRDRDEELQRLQAQLLEDAEPAEEETEELLDADTLDALLEDPRQTGNPQVYQNFSNSYGKNLRNYASGYCAYNSDRTDTDLDSYSEAVREPKRSGGLLWLAVLLLVLVGTVVGAIVWMYLGLGGAF